MSGSWLPGSSSTGSAYELRKTGTGTLELTGGTESIPSSLYTLRANDGDVVLDGPVDYRWIRLGEIHDLPIPGASHKILAHLEKSHRKE